MADKSAIEWTDATWNPVTGCTKVSPGCDNCYAERQAMGRLKRFYPEGFDHVVLRHDRLEQPLHWREPRKIFVCSQSDLFHPRVPFKFIWQVFDVMCHADQHIFQILTKRPGRMAHFAKEYDLWWGNVWAGTSVENAKYLPRLDVLARVPAPVRFVSLEPLLGPVDLRPWLGCEMCRPGASFPEGIPWGAYCGGCNKRIGDDGLSWVIVGGESGPRARPMHPDWVRSMRDQCQLAAVPFFFKQWGEWKPLDQIDGQIPPGLISWWGDKDDPWKVGTARVGRKAAGALLDGKEWRKTPL